MLPPNGRIIFSCCLCLSLKLPGENPAVETSPIPHPALSVPQTMPCTPGLPFRSLLVSPSELHRAYECSQECWNIVTTCCLAWDTATPADGKARAKLWLHSNWTVPQVPHNPEHNSKGWFRLMEAGLNWNYWGKKLLLTENSISSIRASSSHPLPDFNLLALP